MMVRARLMAIALLAVAGRAAQAQAPGTVSGKVTDAASGQPVQAAQISVVGTNLGGITNEAGQYTLRGVPARQITLRVLRVGYSEQTQLVTVNAGAAATADFQLRQVSVNLAPVVTTATGETRAVEVGSAIARVDAAKTVEQSPVANINDLLNSRAPGVQMLTSGATGAGGRVRIRGTNSLSLANDPVYIVDGIRIEASSSGQRAQGIGLGGTTTSRLNDINPEEIESIEVIKGPSAATLYGTDAANGVIVITTKKGRAGAARWTGYTEQGGLKYLQDFPTNYAGFGKTSAGAATAACTLIGVAAKTCTKDSVRTLNILDAPDLTIFGTGYRSQYGLQLSGGTESIRYFTSGEWEAERNPLQLPEFERNRLNSIGRAIPNYQETPNRLEKKTGRVNLNASPNSKLDLALSTGYIDNDQRIPNLDNNLFSPFAQALFGRGYRTTTVTSTGAVLNGYQNFTPGDILEETYSQAINRSVNSLNANWRPTEWLSGRSELGLDFLSRRETDICRFQTCPDNGTTRQGYSLDDRSTIFNYTANASGTASYQPFATIGMKTSAGVQFNRNQFERARATGTTLPPGALTPASGSVASVQSATDEVRTLGFYAQQDFAWREVLFANVAVRFDNNSAFGANFKGVAYPKAQVSYVLSDETFFPKPAWLDQLRVRSAVGESGVRPGTNDALQFLTGGREATARLSASDLPGLTLNAPGNRELKPETTREYEAGIDGTLLSGRVNVELTYYAKRSKNALIARVIPPSEGTGATTRFENLGAVTNKGFEALINSQLVQRRAFAWDVTLSGSTNANKLVTMGVDAQGKPLPDQVTATTRQKAGYPLNGYWQRKYTYSDANNDGLIVASEVTVDDSASFIGYSIPKYEATFTNGFDLFNRALRVQALIDYKGGHYLYNNTERFKCIDAQNCRARFDPTAPLDQQARSVAGQDHAARTLVGFMEKADFVRFRELSLTYNAPDGWAQRFLRARGLGATLAARNIALFTDYTGMDPESSYGQGDLPADFLTLPPPSYLTLRLNVRF